MNPSVVVRNVPPGVTEALSAAGVHPVLARVLAARGITGAEALDTSLERMLPATSLAQADAGATILADAIAARRRLVIVADYDADGATACAVGVLALRAFGAEIDYLVPNRFEYGYGLTPEIVRLAREVKRPDLLITVDNGIASLDGVDEANRHGIPVLVTDHHLPGAELPRALAIVNPNQPGCAFPSKNLAGVGVMFYLMLALRAELRRRGAFAARTEPNLAQLLDLVALGTVADVVPLDANNRILVAQGLKRIRSGRGRAGLVALLRVAGRDPARAQAYDLGFVAGPRLNAAGRLDDMTVGIECLITDDAVRAAELARTLDALNRERRSIEADMQAGALASLEKFDPRDACSMSLFDPGWHQGVIGILASRLKDRFHRPCIAFARGNGGEIKGSGRSIRALHLRDALDLVTKRDPGLVLKFGGHAAAAGLTVREQDFGRFAAAFESVVATLVTPGDLEQVIETDGELAPADLSLEAAAALEAPVWGQGFPAPSFVGEFEVRDQRIVGEKHLKLRLAAGGRPIDAIAFNRTERLSAAVRAVYRLTVNEFNGQRTAQLIVEHCAPA